MHYKGLPSKSKSKSESESESKESIVERTKLRRQRFDEIANQEKMIHPELFKEYFEYLSPSKMYNALSDTKNTKNTKKHNIQVNLIKSSLINFKKDVENASKYDVNKIEEMNKIANIAESILYLNNDDQKASGLKILTPNQMLSRLPISLAQLKAANNSEKLKNEIRQLLYSWYRSKKLTKQIYKNLINII